MDPNAEAEKVFGLTPTCSELSPAAVESKICSDWHRASCLEQQIPPVEVETVMK